MHVRVSKLTKDPADGSLFSVYAFGTTVRVRACACDLENCCFAPQVWTFVLSNAVVRSHSVGQAYQPEMRSSKLKIVCVDAKLVDPDANPE